MKRVILLLSLFIASQVFADSPKASWVPKASSAAQETYADIQKTLGIVPQFLKSFPEEGISGAWQEFKAVQLSSTTAIPPKYKELIGLAVAAQIPCRYCSYAHTEFAKLNGADDRELREAIAVSALVRHWSTYVNGIQEDEDTFRKEVDKIVSKAKEAKEEAESKSGTARPELALNTSEDVYKDVEANFGVLPEFVKQFPEDGVNGAWRTMKEFHMNPNTALSPKYKELTALAVSAQIPCKYCIYFHTETAKLNGASEKEIREALAMSSLTRQWSTVLNGSLSNDAQFEKEIKQILAHAKKEMKGEKQTARLRKKEASAG